MCLLSAINNEAFQVSLKYNNICKTVSVMTINMNQEKTWKWLLVAHHYYGRRYDGHLSSLVYKTIFVLCNAQISLHSVSMDTTN
jgi:hypothetical protein